MHLTNNNLVHFLDPGPAEPVFVEPTSQMPRASPVTQLPGVSPVTGQMSGGTSQMPRSAAVTGQMPGPLQCLDRCQEPLQ